MIWELLTTAWILVAHTKETYNYVPSAETYISPHDFEPVKVKFTFYISTGHRTASGVYPQFGMVASSRDHLGDVALLYTADRQYIGSFECTDTGGTDGLKKGTVIDIYAGTDDMVEKLAEEYGTVGYVKWVKADG